MKVGLEKCSCLCFIDDSGSAFLWQCLSLIQLHEAFLLMLFRESQFAKSMHWPGTFPLVEFAEHQLHHSIQTEHCFTIRDTPYPGRERSAALLNFSSKFYCETQFWIRCLVLTPGWFVLDTEIFKSVYNCVWLSILTCYSAWKMVLVLVATGEYTDQQATV